MRALLQGSVSYPASICSSVHLQGAAWLTYLTSTSGLPPPEKNASTVCNRKPLNSSKSPPLRFQPSTADLESASPGQNGFPMAWYCGKTTAGRTKRRHELGMAGASWGCRRRHRWQGRQRTSPRIGNAQGCYDEPVYLLKKSRRQAVAQWMILQERHCQAKL